jgi:dihydroxy-acid dehydratase
VRLDIPNRKLDVVISDEELAQRWQEYERPELENQTPWQELYRAHVGQLSTGGCLEFATAYRRAAEKMPRDNH